MGSFFLTKRGLLVVLVALSLSPRPPMVAVAQEAVDFGAEEAHEDAFPWEMNIITPEETQAPSNEATMEAVPEENEEVASMAAPTPDSNLEQGEPCVLDKYGFQSQSRKLGTTFRVGVNAIRGFEAAIREYGVLFGTYLTETAGKRFDPPLTFEMVPMTFQDFFDAADIGELDFFFVNPGIMSCLGVELAASALATVIARLNIRGRVHELDIFAGVMIALKERKDIQTVQDFKGKIIAAGALSMILAGQVQFFEMEQAGVSFVNDPKQVVFTYNQFDVVNGVLDGSFDVGFVRTDQIERGVDSEGHPLDTGLFNVISPKIYVMENGDMFPFMHSTDMFPEFAFGMLPHVPSQVAMEVQQALFDVSRHAAVAQGLYACQEAMGDAYCDSLPFPESFATHSECDTTKEIARIALNATGNANVAGFRTARSYFSVRTMQEDGGFMVKNDKGELTCTRASRLYEGVRCPVGYIKVDEAIFETSCAEQGLSCEEGFDCFCKPCQLEVTVRAIDDEGVEINKCSKNEVCAAVEQTLVQKFRLQDHAKRDRIDIRAVLDNGKQSQDVPVTRIDDSYSYEFEVSNPNTILAEVELFVNDVRIETSPTYIEFVTRNCGSGRKPTEDGICVCMEGDFDINGSCVKSVGIFGFIAALILLIGSIIGYYYIRYKRRMSDQLWQVSAEELHFNEPLEIIGSGSFGEVILAEYRGTKVAIKRAIGNRKAGKGGSRSVATHKSLDDQSYDNVDNETARCGSVTQTNEDAGCISLSMSNDGMDSGDNGKGCVSFNVDNGDIEEGRSNALDLQKLAQYSLQRGGNWARFCPGAKREEALYHRETNIFGGTADYANSRSLARRAFSCFDKQSLRTQEFMCEMRLLSKLRHPCITTVMGAVISPFHPPMLVMEFMEYGSLYELLQNDTMHLGGDIILQVMRDLVQGLRYLHSSRPPIFHGDLKARNILIDSRFRAKVADFGLSEKQKSGLTGTPFFMAPEYLRGNSYTTACDMYSVAIVMYEIYAREDPYKGQKLMRVLSEVCDPSVNRRPNIPERMPQKMVDMMKKLWSADPHYRTQAKDLDRILMEMNSSDAEPVSREQKAGKPQKSSADMLYEVFPRHIADALKAGKKVEPETHEMVTIFFSDIVGFTTISQTMSPIKVSEMLERLYLAFDTLARGHKVFKVETIGDAWMGVTNLDQSQHNEHARNIAEFALAAIDAAAKTLIDEDDPRLGTIQIRVGLHSGSVVSNVIGSLNPRYGLFGDSVNTASRMESNSTKMRIHCSESTAKLLKEQAPQLRVRKRGKLDIKGKGKMTTYWVSRGGKNSDKLPEIIETAPEMERDTEKPIPDAAKSAEFSVDAPTHLMDTSTSNLSTSNLSDKQGASVAD